MISYFCIINLPGVPGREITVFDARDDAAGIAGLASVVEAWPGYETICLYEGERVVHVRTNPAFGFTTAPLLIPDAAA